MADGYAYYDSSRGGSSTVLLGRIYCATGIWDMEKSHRQVRQTDFYFGVDPVLYLGPSAWIILPGRSFRSRTGSELREIPIS